jgi:hypothetical protein
MRVHVSVHACMCVDVSCPSGGADTWVENVPSRALSYDVLLSIHAWVRLRPYVYPCVHDKSLTMHVSTPMQPWPHQALTHIERLFTPAFCKHHANGAFSALPLGCIRRHVFAVGLGGLGDFRDAGRRRI